MGSTVFSCIISSNFAGKMGGKLSEKSRYIYVRDII